MPEWNFFSGACIFAAFFATIPDFDVSHDSVLYSSAVSILVGSAVIVSIHVLFFALSSMSPIPLLQLCYLTLTFLVETSLFLVLCQSMGKRGPQKFTIPVEYAYIPLLIVMLLASIRKCATNPIPVDKRWTSPYAYLITQSTAFQLATLAVFTQIIASLPATNLSYPSTIEGVLPIYILLVILYATPTHEVAKNLHYTLLSTVGKCGILALGILRMGSVGPPDKSVFNRLHDFYLIRISCHSDPQLNYDDLSPIEHLLSYKMIFGHFAKLVYITSACIWFNKIMCLKTWGVPLMSYQNSRHEVVLVSTISAVMLAAFSVSKQHGAFNNINSHSNGMLEGLVIDIIICIVISVICSKYLHNRASDRINTTILPIIQYLNSIKKQY
jgi:hypothetical protein